MAYRRLLLSHGFLPNEGEQPPRPTLGHSGSCPRVLEATGCGKVYKCGRGLLSQLPERLVVLGASNLTRGLATLVHHAGAEAVGPVEVFGALGHGRSYGIRSQILGRSLPGILDSGLWAELGSRPPAPTRAWITDVGNDVLYGVPVATILDWVGECASRLCRLGGEVTLTDLPLFTIERLGRARFLFFRTAFVPACRLSLTEVIDRSNALNEGLLLLARSRGHSLFRLKPEWYGLDPIHIRPRFWREAWGEILGVARRGEEPSRSRTPHSGLSALRLYLARPERRRLMGIEQRCAQPVLRTTDGTSIWLY